MTEAERLRVALTEMTRLRDNALRAAAHADQSIDVDLEGVLAAGLFDLYDWESGELNRIVNRAVVVVRPIVAHAVKRAEAAEAERDALLAEVTAFIDAVVSRLPVESRVRVGLAQIAAVDGGDP